MMLLMLSQDMIADSCTNYPISSSSLCSQAISHGAIIAPLYLASVLDKATIGCFVLLHVIEALPSENIEPLVDQRSVGLLAQSAFV